MFILVDILLRALFAQLFEFLTLYLSNCLGMLMVYKQPFFYINPLTAKLFNLNFHSLEVVSRWRDPQLQVSEN